jgi:hypothetical protein
VTDAAHTARECGTTVGVGFSGSVAPESDALVLADLMAMVHRLELPALQPWQVQVLRSALAGQRFHFMFPRRIGRSALLDLLGP